MSALAKPLVHPIAADSNPLGNLNPLNVEQLMSMSKVDIPAYADNPKPVYKIVFSVLGTDGQVDTTEWVYSVAATALADRNTAYAAIIALASTGV